VISFKVIYVIAIMRYHIILFLCDTVQVPVKQECLNTNEQQWLLCTMHSVPWYCWLWESVGYL